MISTELPEGQDIPESKVVIEDIALDNVNVQLLGEAKGHPTIKISLPSGVDIMKFKSSREEFEEWTSGEKKLTIVGKCSKNSWMGNVIAQVIVEDFELKRLKLKKRCCFEHLFCFRFRSGLS